MKLKGNEILFLVFDNKFAPMNPKMPRCIGHQLPIKIREVIVKLFRIFTEVKEKKVYILHVMRGERQFRAYLLEERSSEIN